MHKLFNIVIGLIFIGFGIFLWNHPAETLVTYSLYLGLVNLLGAGITLAYYLIKKIQPVPYGSIMISTLIGIVMIALPKLSLSFILWIFIFGFLTVAIGYLVVLLNNKSGQRNIFFVILAVLAVVYGLIMLFNPITAANTVAKILSIFVIMNGVSYFTAPTTK